MRIWLLAVLARATYDWKELVPRMPPLIKSSRFLKLPDASYYPGPGCFLFCARMVAMAGGFSVYCLHGTTPLFEVFLRMFIAELGS